MTMMIDFQNILLENLLLEGYADTIDFWTDDNDGVYTREQIEQTVKQFKKLKLSGTKGDIDNWFDKHTFQEFLDFVLKETDKGKKVEVKKEPPKKEEPKKELPKEEPEEDEPEAVEVPEKVYDKSGVNIWHIKNYSKINNKSSIDLSKIDFSKNDVYYINDTKNATRYILVVDSDGNGVIAGEDSKEFKPLADFEKKLKPLGIDGFLSTVIKKPEETKKEEEAAAKEVEKEVDIKVPEPEDALVPSEREIKIMLAKRYKLKVEKFLNLVVKGTYKFRSDNSIEVEGDVDMSGLGLEEIPVPFATVSGDFNCFNNRLTTLKNCPKTVRGNFFCSRNNLTDLRGGPSVVGKTMICSYSGLESLNGAPFVVGSSFLCSGNKLTDLKGAPRDVGWSFISYKNPLKNLVGAPKSIGHNFMIRTPGKSPFPNNPHAGKQKNLSKDVADIKLNAGDVENMDETYVSDAFVKEFGKRKYGL